MNIGGKAIWRVLATLGVLGALWLVVGAPLYLYFIDDFVSSLLP